MPVSSIVVGVDLYPIRAIAGCISLTEDITTEKCKQAISKELQTWKADVVLHDGAPNVGKNWLYDAHQQICLTLNALKLATNFLRGGGWFITKVFRSKDYNALMWVLKQLFKKVHATKPSASRKESAEIFVVCQYYIAPEKIDPKFLDPKYVFEELDLESTQQGSLLHPEKKRIKAEGYSENDFSLRHELAVSAFIAHPSGLNALQGVGQIIFDDKTILNHVRTTPEIQECCKDIKVLGRKDMRLLLNWYKHLRAEMYPAKEKVTIETVETPEKPEMTKEEIEEMEYEQLEKHIADMEMEDAKDVKRKRKKIQKARQKLNEKLNLKMIIKGDSGPQEEDNEVFSLTQIHSMAELDELQDQEPDMLLEEEQSDDEFKPKFKTYQKGEFHLDDDGKYAGGSNSDSDRDSGNDSDDSDNLGVIGLGLGKEDDKRDSRKKSKVKKVDKKSENPLLTDLDTRDKDSKRNQRVQLWFTKDNLKNVEGEADEDFDLDKLTNQYKGRGVRVLGEEEIPKMPLGKKAKRRARHGPKEDEDDSDSDSDNDSNQHETVEKIGGENGYDVVTSEQKVKKIKLNEEELALGALMVQSQKTKRDLVDSAWNRYTFNDDNLPEWFVQDEMVHMRKEAPVTKELVEEYRKKMEELNVRPIKKVMEAKARKKRRALKRFEKAKKKAEAVLETADSSAQEKMRQIKK